jgi:hypothetical protein
VEAYRFQPIQTQTTIGGIMKVGDLVRTKKMYIIMVTGNPSQTNKTLTPKIDGFVIENYNRDAKVSFPSLGYISTFQKTDLTLLSEA